MITVHCTKKLFLRLPLNDQGLLPGQTGPAGERVNELGEWHANLLRIEDQDCILLVHGQTRFPVFLKALTNRDLNDLQWLFEDALMNTLLKLDASQQQLDAAAHHLATLQFDNLNNRSVQGTLNRMAGDIEHMMWSDNITLEFLSTYKTAAWLAEMLCGMRGQQGYIYPYEQMFQFLDNLAEHRCGNRQVRGNIVNLDDYR